jgi:hypothetical protein
LFRLDPWQAAIWLLVAFAAVGSISFLAIARGEHVNS